MDRVIIFFNNVFISFLLSNDEISISLPVTRYSSETFNASASIIAFDTLGSAESSFI